MTTSQTDGGAVELDEDDLADADASMARLDEEAELAETAEVEPAEPVEPVDEAGEPKREDTAEEKTEENTEEKPAEKSDAKTEEKAEEKTEDKSEDDDDKMPEGADRWHPAARKHIDKVLAEKKKVQGQLRDERKAVDQLTKLTTEVGIAPAELPRFLQITAAAIMRGDAAAMKTVAEKLQSNGFAFGAAGGGYSEEDLAEAVAIATKAALEDFDESGAAEKALRAVREKRKGKAGDHPAEQGRKTTSQTPTENQSAQGGDQGAGGGVSEHVKSRIIQMASEVDRVYGADAKRINAAMSAAIQNGRLPRDPADWPMALELIRDAEVANVQAEAARSQAKRPPSPTTTTPAPQNQRRNADAFSDLDKEAGLRR
jgi:hypothetical protein